MNRGRCEYVATSASEVDARKNAGTIPNSGRFHIPMESVAGLNDWALQRFPSTSGLFQGIDGSLIVKINYVEAKAGSQPDVGAWIHPPPCPDHVEICGRVMEPVAAIRSGDQRHL